MSDKPEIRPKWKFCKRCKRLKSVESFQSLGTRHHTYCRRCVVARTQELRLAKRANLSRGRHDGGPKK